jgi:quaternary ammonium compound-resistance protein SugE
MIMWEWVYLVVAGFFEIGWAIGLKYTEGFTKLWPTAFTVVAMIASFVLLSTAVKKIPIGTAYAVWTGIGAVGAAAGGILLFKESQEAIRIFCIVLIIAGIVGLKVTSGH